MNLKTILGSLSIILTINLNAQTTSKYITKDKLNQDFDFLVKSIKKTHPNPYSVISKSDFDYQVSSIKTNFKDSLNLKSYYQLIAPFVASLHDGHTSLTFPGRKLLNSNDNLFPYIIKASIEKPYLKVTENISNEYMQIPVDAEILKIDNLTSEEIIQKIIKNTSGESDIYRLKMGADFNMFAFLFGSFHELKENTNVEYNYKNKNHNITIPTVTLNELMEIAKKRNPSSNNKLIEEIPSFSLDIDNHNKTAIIDIHSFDYKKKFEDFLKESFEHINSNKIKKLIIDIRENGGGNSVLAEELMKYISNEPFRLFDKTLIKYSQLQKDFYDDYCKNDSQYCETYNYIKSKKNGEIDIFSIKDLILPYPKEKQFKGKIYLLTSSRTFSSAMNFAQAFKHYKIGKIIGEETGGWIVSYGDKIITKLPESNIPLSISTKQFYTVGTNDKDFHGVKPDVKIKAENALKYIQK